jgi:hypothetical protein
VSQGAALAVVEYVMALLALLAAKLTMLAYLLTTGFEEYALIALPKAMLLANGTPPTLPRMPAPAIRLTALYCATLRISNTLPGMLCYPINILFVTGLIPVVASV